MPQSLDYDTVRHVNQHRFDSVVLPAECVGDTQVDPDDPIAVGNQRHRISKVFQQVMGIAAVDDAGRVIHIARAAGTIIGAKAGSVAAAVGAATVAVEVKKNGTTILTSPMSIDSGTGAYGHEDGAISVTSYVTNDVFTVHLDETTGGGTQAQGVFVQVDFDEEPE
jgi:hypothetical protein